MEKFIILVLLTCHCTLSYVQAGVPDPSFRLNNTATTTSEIKSPSTFPRGKYHLTTKSDAYPTQVINSSSKLPIAKVVASADDGNVASNTIDGNYSTRWSANGNNQWIRYYLDTTTTIGSVNIAWYKGNERKTLFDIQTSLDSTNWVTAFSGRSSGSTTALEVYSITPVSSRYIRILCHGNNLNTWNSITEAEIIKDTRLLQTLDPNPSLNIAMGHLARAQAFTDKAKYPRSTNPDGTIKRVAPGDWTSGFFPGSLWLMYENTKDTIWRTRAEKWNAALEAQKNNTSTHDVGFMLYSSFGNGYRLTGNQKYKAILLQGAKSLSTRFNSTVGCIKSWNNSNYTFPVIIDNMMNLEILFWATKVSGDSSFHKIAVRHALTTMANHFRPDNSSYHLVDYNPVDGSVISKRTVQGLNNLSDWARGQAWGLYGFTMCYRETGDIRFLNMAKKIADFYITHPNMPADLVPFWDFDAFDYRDASAASVAASALLELSQFAPEQRTTYYNFGLSILKSLATTAYTASVGTNNDFILKHSVGNKPANSEINTPICYADYYFLEALLRHKKPAPTLTAIGGNGQITLKWNASTGAMFYSIKRATVSAGPYTTIVSHINDTNYTNSALNSGTTYFYKVTSWNAVGPGETSGEASAIPDAAPLEAEGAVLHGAVVASNQPGFTGSGFVDYINASGDFIEWTVNTSNADLVLLRFRYANGGATDRPLKLEVNGQVVAASLPFPSTGSFATWSVSSVFANLIAGTNKIRLTTIGSNGPNIDHLMLNNNSRLEAEDAVLDGAVVASDQPGFTGSGFADYKNASGDFIDWTVNALVTGSYSLNFRYANGGSADRPLKLEVNGVMLVASLAFSPTGAWSTWSVSSATANLMAGTNKVKLTAIGASGPNVDHLAFNYNYIQSAQRSASAKGQVSLMQNVPRVDINPNPVANTLSISIHGLQTNNRSAISVLSVSGAVIKTIQPGALNKNIQLDVSSLSGGVYFIKVISGDKILYKQFVKL